MIRIANENDAPTLARMFEAFNADYRVITITPEQMAARLRACAAVEPTLLAEVDGQQAGFVCVRVVPHMSDDTPYAEVSDLFVEPAFRRQGVGSALLAAAAHHARERGAHEIVVQTGTDNDNAQALYRRAGYVDYAVALELML